MGHTLGGSPCRPAAQEACAVHAFSFCGEERKSRYRKNRKGRRVIPATPCAASHRNPGAEAHVPADTENEHPEEGSRVLEPRTAAPVPAVATARSAAWARRGRGPYLIICGTVTLEFSSKAFIMSPLHRMLSTHCGQRGARGQRLPHSGPGPAGALPSERGLRLARHGARHGRVRAQRPVRPGRQSGPHSATLGVGLASLSLGFSACKMG